MPHRVPREAEEALQMRKDKRTLWQCGNPPHPPAPLPVGARGAAIELDFNFFTPPLRKGGSLEHQERHQGCEDSISNGLHEQDRNFHGGSPTSGIRGEHPFIKLVNLRITHRSRSWQPNGRLFVQEGHCRLSWEIELLGIDISVRKAYTFQVLNKVSTAATIFVASLH